MVPGSTQKKGSKADRGARVMLPPRSKAPDGTMASKLCRP